MQDQCVTARRQECQRHCDVYPGEPETIRRRNVFNSRNEHIDSEEVSTCPGLMHDCGCCKAWYISSQAGRNLTSSKMRYAAVHGQPQMVQV